MSDDPILDEMVREWRLSPEEAAQHADAIRGTMEYHRRKLGAAVGAAKHATIHEIQRRIKRDTN